MTSIRIFRALYRATAILALVGAAAACGGRDDGPQGRIYPIITRIGYGYMDSTGNVVTEPRFDDAGYDFVDGLAMIVSGQLNGLIDSTGTVVLEPNQGEAIIPGRSFRDGLAKAHTDSGTGFIDRYGEWKIPATLISSYGFYDGTAPACGEGRKWGYIDTEGSVVIPFQFDDAGFMRDGLAGASLGRHWGGINSSGEWLFEPTHRYVAYFSDHLLRFMDDLKWGLIDTLGNIVVPATYQRLNDHEHGFARTTLGNRWGIITAEGETVIEPTFMDAFITPSAGLWLRDGELGWGVADADGEWMIPPRFEHIVRSPEAPIIVRDGDEWGLVSDGGRIVLEPRMAFIKGFTEGVAAFTPDGHAWGFLDTTGTVVIEPQYDGAGPFFEGLAWFNMGGRPTDAGGIDGGSWGYVDKTGAVVIEPRELDRAQYFTSGMAPVKKFGLWGIIDRQGNYIADPFFDHIEIRGDLAKIIDFKTWGPYFGYMNRRGEFVWHPQRGQRYGLGTSEAGTTR